MFKSGTESYRYYLKLYNHSIPPSNRKVIVGIIEGKSRPVQSSKETMYYTTDYESFAELQENNVKNSKNYKSSAE